MNKLNFGFWLIISQLGAMGSSALAQITPDTTLPNNSAVTRNGEQITIDEGTVNGSNLFHSFSEFNVDTGETAFFNNVMTINNIITRVTGGQFSSIDGVIQANGTANLFLLNPSGINFGPNASLNIGGSFVGSTADSIQFADGSEFSAVNPQVPPLLKVNIPVGLQYGNNNGDITVKGTGHNAFFDFDTFTVDRFERNRGLEVAPENTIGLIGNNIFLEGGNLTVESGNIELGSVAEAGTVEITTNDLGWTFDYGDLNGENINLSDAASIDVSGKGSGNIQIYGDSVNITDGSAIFAETEGNTAGGLSKIKANEVNIIGTDPDLWLPSSIWSDVYLDATGDGGDVLIETGSLLLEDGGQVNVNTFSSGNAGNLRVNATDIQVIGESEGGDFLSALSAQADIFLTGKGGDIVLETLSLLVSDGAQISTNTFGEGDAGNLTVKAQEIKLIGDSEFSSSGLFSSTEAEGHGGNLTVETDLLQITDGAQITTAAFDSGDAGILNITANNIEILGVSEIFPSGIFASTIAEGRGGNLTIKSNSLTVADGAQITTDTFGSGNAGNINIQANSLKLDNTGFEFPSSITASTNNGGGGNIKLNIAGDITINNNSEITADTRGNADGGSIDLVADNLNLNNQSRVSVDSTGLGRAGNIEITVNELNGNQGKITATSLQSGGGDIILATDLIYLNNNSRISTSVFDGTGGGGNIIIDSNYIIAPPSENSDITANAFEGDGGTISITANGIFGLQFREEETELSDITASSEFGFAGTVAINNPDVDPTSGLVELPSQVSDPSDKVIAGCAAASGNSFTATGKGGLPEDPNNTTIHGQTILSDLRDFTASDSKGDLPPVKKQARQQLPRSIVQVNGWVVNQDGEVELVAALPQENSFLKHPNCQDLGSE